MLVGSQASRQLALEHDNVEFPLLWRSLREYDPQCVLTLQQQRVARLGY